MPSSSSSSMKRSGDDPSSEDPSPAAKRQEAPHLAVFAWGDITLPTLPTLQQPFLREVRQVDQLCEEREVMVRTESGNLYLWFQPDDDETSNQGRLFEPDDDECPTKMLHNLEKMTDFSCELDYHWAATDGDALILGCVDYGSSEIFGEPERYKQLSGELKQVACNQDGVMVLSQTGSLSFVERTYGGLWMDPRSFEELQDKKVVQIAAGFGCSAAITDDGALYTWGSGPLGHGDTDEEQSTPKMVESLQPSKVCQVSLDLEHAAVVTEEGEVWTWGINRYGILGIGSDKWKVDLPVLVQGALEGEKVTKVQCIQDATFALTEKGELFSWGRGSGGMLGFDTTIDISQPQKVQTLDGYRVEDISCTTTAAIALVDLASSPNNDMTCFSDMVDNEEFSDVSFLVEGQVIHAHRNILVSRCKYFSTMFRSGMKESAPGNQIAVPDARHKIFLSFLKFVYTGNLDFGTSANDTVAADAVDLYQLGQKYDIPRLRTMCAIVVETEMNTRSAAMVLLKTAHDKKDPLRKLAIQYIRKNFGVVSRTEGMKDIYMNRADLWQEIVKGRALTRSRKGRAKTGTM